MTWQQEVTSRYGSIAAGLIIGTAARYGLALSEGKRLTRVGFIGDMLQLGLLGLAGVVLSDKLGLTGDLKAFVAALSAMSSDRLTKLVRDRFLRAAAGGQMMELLPSSQRDAIIGVPAGIGEPEGVDLQQPPEDSAEGRLKSNLRRAYGERAKGRAPDDQIEQIRRLDHD